MRIIRDGAAVTDRGIHNGRLYYITIALLIASAVAVLLVATLIFSHELKNAGKQAEAAIESTISMGIRRHQSIRLDPEYLLEFDATQRAMEIAGGAVGGKLDSEELSDLEEQVALIMEEISNNENDEYSVCIYLQPSGTAVWSDGEADANSVPDYVVQDLDFSGLDCGDSEVLFDPHPNNAGITWVVGLGNDAYLLVMSEKTIQLEELIGNLIDIYPDLQIAYYDRFDTVHVFTDETNLTQQFSYADFIIDGEQHRIDFDQGRTAYSCFYIGYLDSKTV
ncbi:MAG: hypothetical protein ACOYIK_11535, partial [Coriobacteriales bacterium]